jgi:hypothetical protein
MTWVIARFGPRAQDPVGFGVAACASSGLNGNTSAAAQRATAVAVANAEVRIPIVSPPLVRPDDDPSIEPEDGAVRPGQRPVENAPRGERIGSRGMERHPAPAMERASHLPVTSPRPTSETDIPEGWAPSGKRPIIG